MTTTAAAERAMFDTNVLVYALDRESNFHDVSRALLARAADRESESRYSVLEHFSEIEVATPQ